MLLALTEYLAQYYSAFNVFSYLTMRAILGILTALSIALLVGPFFIKKLSINQMGQVVRDDGPETHFSKAGTPTMGGALILVAIIVSTLLWGDLSNRYIWVVLIVTSLFGVVGWIDDYKKIVYQDSDGLIAKYKYFWQSLIGFGAALYLYTTAQTEYETLLLIPYMKDVFINLGPFYILLTYLVIVGSSNAVNLTDGLDGLAIMPTVMVAGAFGIFAYLTGHTNFSDYLGIPYIQGVGEIVVICAAIVGAGLGFLWSVLNPL